MLMSVFISNIDTAKLNVQFFLDQNKLTPYLLGAVCSFIKVLIFMNKTLSSRLRVYLFVEGRGSRVEGSMSRARVPCRGSRVTFFFSKIFFWKR